MATPNPYRQYQTTQVQTAGPGQLTLMCYDGALRFLTQAREAMAKHHFEGQSANIGRAQALLAELQKGLDFERGGEIAQSLNALYTYFYDRLIHANIKDDLAALEEVHRSLAELRDAWAGALLSAGTPNSETEAGRRTFAVTA